MTPRIFLPLVIVLLCTIAGCSSTQSTEPQRISTESSSSAGPSAQSTAFAQSATRATTATPFEFRCGNVGEIPLAECEALVAIYETNPDADMFGQWLTNHEPCFEWQHIACRDGHVVEMELIPKSFYNNQAKVGGYDPGIITLPPEIGNLKSLTKLDLSYNRFAELPPEIGELDSLQILIFTHNNLLTTLPPEIGNLSALEELILAGSTALVELPPEIGNLSALKKLVISGSDITGLPTTIGNLSSLEDFTLTSNHSFTSLPPEFGNLSKLSVLRLIDNRLTSLPDTFGNLSSLQCLQIDQREFKSLPADLSNLSQEVQDSLDMHQRGNRPSMECPF